MENTLVVFRELNMEYNSEIPILEIYPKRVKTGTQTDTCKPMSTAAAATIARKRKQPKCPSVDEQIPAHVEYYSASESNEILIHDTTWMNLEDFKQVN